MGAHVTLEVLGKTLRQVEHYGRAVQVHERRDLENYLPVCTKPSTSLMAVIEQDLDTGEISYTHTRLNGHVFDHFFQDKMLGTMKEYEDKLYDAISLDMLGAFSRHEMPCTAEHDWTTRPVCCQDTLVFYGVNTQGKVNTSSGQYFQATDQGYAYAAAGYCPESARMVRSGDKVALVGKHFQAPRMVVNVEADSTGDITQAVVVDYDPEKRIQVHMYIIMACLSHIDP